MVLPGDPDLTVNPVEAEAARWAARIDAGALSDAEQEAFAAWLEADSRHRGAFVRLSAAWQAVDPLSSVAVPAALVARPAQRLSRRGLFGLAAAGIAGLAVAPAVLRVLGAERFSTRLGELRRFPLEDGSSVAMNTHSRIAIAFEPERRAVSLDEGEAWFDVAKDVQRPFVVEVGPIRVQAVGTSFSVLRQDDKVRVIVSEGVVETWSTLGRRDEAVRLGEGTKAVLSEATAVPVRLSQLDPKQLRRSLAWQDGGIALEGDTLAEAVREFNRYNRTKIMLDDAALGQKRLVGYFKSTDPMAFAETAASTLGAGISVAEGEIHIGLSVR